MDFYGNVEERRENFCEQHAWKKDIPKSYDSQRSKDRFAGWQNPKKELEFQIYEEIMREYDAVY